MSAEKWKEALRRTPDCIPIDRFGEELTPREHSHLAHCATCQAELALWQRVDDEEETPAEREAVRRVAAEVRNRLHAAPHPPFGHPLPASRGEGLSRPSPRLRGEGGRRPDEGRRRRFHPGVLAAAAMVVLAIALGVLVQNREPSIEGPVTEIRTYRSAGVDVIAPVGDVAAAPATLQWKPVSGATQYDVDVTEVDHTVLWHTTTAGPSSALPPSLVSQFVPGKTVLWQVKARRDRAIVADSGVQRFRVATAR